MMLLFHSPVVCGATTSHLSPPRQPRRFSRVLVSALVGLLVTSALTVADSRSTATASTCLTENSPPPGAGTVADPYRISTADHLAWIGEKKNFLTGTGDARLEQKSACPERLTRHYVMEADISLSGRAWSPIGQYVVVSEPGNLGFDQVESEAFSGMFDGAGHTITGLTQLATPTVSGTGLPVPSTPTDHSAAGSQVLPTYGLFGWVRGTGNPNELNSSPAVVKNLTIAGAQFAFPTPYGGEGAGVLVGLASNAVIQDVHTSGRIEAVGTRFGGLLGRSASFNPEPVKILSATSAVDLVIGFFDLGGPNQLNPESVGGLIGDFDSWDSLVSDSFATGNVTGSSRVGGLIGRDDAVNSVILKSGASGTVTGSGSGVGALVGEADSRYFYTFASGDVEGGDEVGGLLGDMDSSGSRVLNSYARGDVVADREEIYRAGGLVGNIPDTNRQIANSYATGTVTHSGSPPLVDQLGAFAGRSSTASLSSYAVTNSFVDATSAGALPAIARATPLSLTGVVEIVTTTQMKSIDTYLAAQWAIVDGWAAFNAPDDGNAIQGTHQVWGICSGVNGGYPYLLWQYDSNPCGGGGGDRPVPPRGAASVSDSSVDPESVLARTGFEPLWALFLTAGMLGLLGIGMLTFRRRISQETRQ